MFGADSRTRPERPDGDNRSDSLSLSKESYTTAEIFGVDARSTARLSSTILNRPALPMSAPRPFIGGLKYAGSITPGWKLTKASINQSGTFLSAIRDRTNDLTISIKEGGIEREVTAAEAFLLFIAKRGLEGNGPAARSAMAAIEVARSARRTRTDCEILSIVRWTMKSVMAKRRAELGSRRDRAEIPMAGLAAPVAIDRSGSIPIARQAAGRQNQRRN
jgi:hypothetical protein